MRKTITPEAELRVMAAIVEAMSVAEAAGISFSGGPEVYSAGRYSIEWDSIPARWTLVAETDDAINVCSFNNPAPECTGFDPCDRCVSAAEEREGE